MAWTNPRTWNVGEVLTAALLNTHVRDNLLMLAPVYGQVVDFAGITVPAKWIEPKGDNLVRASYLDLFAALTKTLTPVTISLASPGVVTFVAHGLNIGDRVYFTTTGTLPTGIVANTNYYVMTVPTADTFTLGTTRTVTVATNAISVTTQVNTSVSQSGVHTCVWAPHGTADSTHFYLPDYTGAMGIGFDAAAAGWPYKTLGVKAGERTHTLITGEIPSHQHAIPVDNAPLSGGSGSPWGSPNAANWMTTALSSLVGGDGTHNNLPPTIAVKKIMYTGV